jgi:hypothetical protein
MKEHEHGTNQRYNLGCCRCTPCRHAHAVYSAARRRLIAYGRWHPRTDTATIRAHMRTLMGAPETLASIAERAGLSISTVNRVMYGRNRKAALHTQTQGATAAKLLALTPRVNAAFIPSAGTRRRLQALCAIGWTLHEQGARLGMLVHSLRYIMRVGATVRSTTAAKIAAMYDELSCLPAPDGPAARAVRRLAARRGFAPPLAWDEDSIDDPTASPAPAAPPDETPDEVVIRRALAGRLRWSQMAPVDRDEVLRRMADTGWTRTRICRILGFSGTQILAQLARVGRTVT